MEKNTLYKWLFLLVMIIGSLMLVTPVDQKVRLGLDLKGGISFIVEIDRDALAKRLKDANPDADEAKLQEILDEEIGQAKDNAVEVIRNRVDTIGIAEPSIYPKGEDRIIVQLPGVDEDKQVEARDSIMSVAFLEFRLVHQSSEEWVEELFAEGKAPRGFKVGSAEQQYYIRDRDAMADEDMDRAYYDRLREYSAKPRSEFLLMKDELKDGSTIFRPYYVETRTQMTGDALKEARVEYGNFNEPRISLEFNSQGARDFAQVTRDYAPRGERNFDSEEGRQLAIVLDETLYSAPVIRTPILDGRAEITGVFSPSEATRLVNVLRAGSLPAPVKIIEERQVSPSLGHDSIESGVKAAVMGLTLVLVFTRPRVSVRMYPCCLSCSFSPSVCGYRQGSCRFSPEEPRPARSGCR